MNINIYFVILLLPFALIGVIMAYLITYNEYLHHYQNKKKPIEIALKTALFTFIFFIVLGFIIIYAITHYIK